MKFIGHLSVVNQALAGLRFQGARDFSGIDVVRIYLDDQGNTGIPHTSLSAKKEIQIKIIAVNDAPVIGAPSQVVNVGEDADYVFYNASGIQIVDVDARANDALKVVVSSGNGLVSLSRVQGLNATSSGGKGVYLASITFYGTLQDVNDALATIAYRGKKNFNGMDYLHIEVFDQGNSGSGGERTAVRDIPIQVLAANVAPYFTTTLPAELSFPEASTQSLGLGRVAVYDTDAGNELLDMRVSSSQAAVLEVQRVRTIAPVVDTVYEIVANGTLGGTFRLQLGASIVSGDISAVALGAATHERSTGVTGQGQDDSLEYHVRQMVQAFASSSSTAANRTTSPVEVEVWRSLKPQDLSGHRWTVTFKAVRYDFPLLSLERNQADHSGEIVVRVLQAANRLQGTFSLHFNGRSTGAIAHDASSEAVKTMIESMATVTTVDVSRTGPDAVEGYSWNITFYVPSGNVPALSADSTALKTECKRRTKNGKFHVNVPFLCVATRATND